MRRGCPCDSQFRLPRRPLGGGRSALVTDTLATIEPIRTEPVAPVPVFKATASNAMAFENVIANLKAHVERRLKESACPKQYTVFEEIRDECLAELAIRLLCRPEEEVVRDLVAFINRVVRNHVAGYYRDRSRRRYLLEDSCPPLSAIPDDSPRCDPVLNASVKELQSRILNKVEGTDAEILRCLEGGMCPSDVAKQLGMDPSRFRMRLCRLRQRLRLQLQRLLREFEDT